MRARAPGKVVLSGAYAVLEGAPAVVSAVSRYVTCDASRAADRVTPEVRAALAQGPFPAFDAAELRDGGRKLGLGSSAAILVASLAAVHAERHPERAALIGAIEAPALVAHRIAQGGGSGIDVAASTRGGTLIATRRAPDVLELVAAPLPRGLCVEAWASDVSASTPELLRAVARFREERPREHGELMGTLGAAATRAAHALGAGDAAAFIRELSLQRELLSRLGSASNVPIVTPEVHQLAEWAKTRGATVLPSGAGGGDIVLWVALTPSPPEFHSLAAALRHRPVPLELDAPGVHVVPDESRV